MWLQSPNIGTLHGFSTRSGGVSGGAFSSMNLGGSDDLPENIKENRKRALYELGLAPEQLCYLKQVHGTEVVVASPGIQQGDALVSNKKALALAVSVADCFPIIFSDERNAVVGVAHAGWRGTAGKIAEKVVREMEKLGADPSEIMVSIGPGISQERFEVGGEVLEQFRAAGFPERIIHRNRIDLAEANRFVLQQAGVPAMNIHCMSRCSFEDDFFSYRRDKGITGRMWGLISMR